MRSITVCMLLSTNVRCALKCPLQEVWQYCNEPNQPTHTPRGGKYMQTNIFNISKLSKMIKKQHLNILVLFIQNKSSPHLHLDWNRFRKAQGRCKHLLTTVYNIHRIHLYSLLRESTNVLSKFCPLQPQTVCKARTINIEFLHISATYASQNVAIVDLISCSTK